MIDLAKKWCYRKPDEILCKAIAAELNIPRSITSILMHRGLENSQQIDSFFNATLADLPSPFLMKGMNEAVKIIHEAIVEKRPVFIYGDYDVDGTTGIAVLAIFLRDLGLDVHCYQPNRLTDGYGLHSKYLELMQKEAVNRAGALVTVDCGISDIEVIQEAKQLGFTVIVTDHHRPPAVLPPADAILNPVQNDCEFPFKHLAGVGVSFYLIMGLRSYLAEKGFWDSKGPPNLKELLDLVALGTVSDMVQLQGVNRILVKAGLEALSTTNRLGISKLCKVSGINGKEITAEDIGYRLAPRINAAGRIGDPGRALELLITTDAKRAEQIAKELDNENNQRRSFGDQVFNEASEIARELVSQGKKCLIIGSENWHPGVIGIAASRLLNRFYRPTIIFSIAAEFAKGSGRSVSALNMHAILEECEGILVEYGGHKAAAGLSLRKENINTFKELFEKKVSEKISNEDLKPTVWIDQQVTNGEIYKKPFLDWYLRLEPFGIGNAEPVFTSSGQIKNPKVVGQNHLKFSWKDNGSFYEGIGFDLGPLLSQINNNDTAEIAFNLRRNYFRGKEEWQLQIADLRPYPG